MTTEETGGYAFPADATSDKNGMTLRDWFAGMALQGALSQYGFGDISKYGAEKCLEACATNAYELADAMIKERSKT